MARAELKQQDADVIKTLYDIIVDSDEHIKQLTSELESRLIETQASHDKLKQFQEAAYADNIDLSNLYKNMKVTMGIIRGKRDREEVNFERMRFQQLTDEVEVLSAQKRVLEEQLNKKEAQIHKIAVTFNINLDTV